MSDACTTCVHKCLRFEAFASIEPRRYHGRLESKLAHNRGILNMGTWKPTIAAYVYVVGTCAIMQSFRLPYLSM